MSLPTSAIAYSDCYDFMDKAMGDAVGARLRMASQADAMHFRLRCNQARKINRDDNARTYDIGNPMHGRSSYDRLVFRVKEIEDHVYVYAERMPDITDDVETLSGQEALPAPEPQLSLPSPTQDVVVGDDLPVDVIDEPSDTIRRRI